jgi:hypothetical protein
LALALIAVVGVVAALTVSALLRSPEWLDRDEVLRSGWKLLNAVAGTVSLLTAIGVSATVSTLTSSTVTITAFGVSVAALVFVTVQSTLSDFRMRMADRWTLRLASVAVGAVGVAEILTHGSTDLLVAYAMFTLIAFAFNFIPKLGASDGRALVLVVLASIPTLGLGGFITPMWGMVALAIAYSVVVAIKSKDITVLVKKVSTPLVPMIVAPYAMAVSVMPVLASL